MPVKLGSYAWVVGYSERYGAPFKPVFHSDSQDECQKWLDTHAAQYPTGATVVMSGEGFPHLRDE